MRIPVGINIWSRLIEKTFSYLDQVAAPYESLWFPDHVQYADNNVAEGWSLLAFAMARYPGKLCGHEVLCNSFRNPAHLAKMAATIQALSGGRLVLGIGAGWNQEEYAAYGWPFPSARVRIAQLDEAIQVIRAMWQDAPAQFNGEHYQIANAYCEPHPQPQPPIMVGGMGEKHLLRVVAQRADWWNYVFTDLPTYAHKQRVLQEHCNACGRNYAEITQAVVVRVLIGETEAEVKRLLAAPDMRPLEQGMAGTPQQIAEALSAIVRQGAQRLSINFADAPRPDGTLLFAERVLPAISQD
jgi:alkanesulfonate monooxygenase SsuD/methylene tetrahydromethanopterin reductase-like flavin-dependent oxidoreductase (luciferase family)